MLTERINIQASVPVIFADALPQSLERDWIPGYHVKSLSGEFGELASQSIEVKGISSLYVTGIFRQSIRFKLSGNPSVIFVIVLLNGSIDILQSIQIHHLKKSDRFSILYFPRHSTEILAATTGSSDKFEALIVAYPASFIQSALISFPWLYSISEQLKLQEVITDVEIPLSASLYKTVYELLHTPFSPNVEDYFYRLLRDLSADMFKTYASEINDRAPFNLQDLRCIHEAKDYIDNHLLERITIKQLSRKVGINQLKLKKGFKSVYGSGVHGYQVQQRLTIAKTALEKTLKPIHQIARQAGYNATPNFSAAFKKFFGVTTLQHRKNIRNQ